VGAISSLVATSSMSRSSVQHAEARRRPPRQRPAPGPCRARTRHCSTPRDRALQVARSLGQLRIARGPGGPAGLCSCRVRSPVLQPPGEMCVPTPRAPRPGTAS
jgi:hypothetical protein